MPMPFIDKTNYPSKDFLHINSSGFSKYTYQGKENTVHIYRPDGRVDVHFLFILNGNALVKLNGKSLTVSAGECVVYLPDVPQDYTFCATESCPIIETMWLHFCGTATSELLSTADINTSKIVKPSSVVDMKHIFESLIRAHRFGDILTACGNVLRLAALLSPKILPPRTDGERLIRRAAEYIELHYNEDIDFDKCAKDCRLSRSRFTHLFTDTIGMPPYKYQLSLRLSESRELLRYSSMSVGEIAYRCGFSDPLYFSRLFKNTHGLSPSEYKKSDV